MSKDKSARSGQVNISDDTSVHANDMFGGDKTINNYFPTAEAPLQAQAKPDGEGKPLWLIIVAFVGCGGAVIAALIGCFGVVIGGGLASPLLPEIYRDWFHDRSAPTLTTNQPYTSPAIQTPALTPTYTPVGAPIPTPLTIQNTNSFFFTQANAVSFTDTGGLCRPGIVRAPEPNKPLVHKLVFTHTAEGSYCGWAIQFHAFDASEKTTLAFWVRGDKGGEQFKVGLKDQTTRDGSEPKILLTASNVWERKIVPLAQFNEIVPQDLSHLENISLSSEYKLGDATIYINEFVFEP